MLLNSKLGTFEQKMTTQMLLNNKRLDKLVLHNGCGLSVVRLALSLFACDILKRVQVDIFGSHNKS